MVYATFLFARKAPAILWLAGAFINGHSLIDCSDKVLHKMMNDSFKACGGFLGFLIGSFIERHFIRYEIPQGSTALPVLACVGFALQFAWKELLAPATIVPLLGGHWGNLLARFLMVLFAIVVWPLVIRKTCAARAKATQTA